MKFCLRVITVFLLSYTTIQAQIKLKAVDFAGRLDGQDSIQLVDVRTPDEFAQGHLKNAMNIDYKSKNFAEQINGLAKNKPVALYCLAGSRSEAAAQLMAGSGFTEIYDLEGGYMGWTFEKRPVEGGMKEPPVVGMAPAVYDSLVNSEQPVLIDFTAKWCAPCKVLYPSIKKMESEFKDRAVVRIIDIDQNPAIAEHLEIRYLPLIYLYKNGEIVWQATGVVSESKLREVLKEQL